MNGLARNTTVKRPSRRFNGYEPLDEATRSENVQEPPRRSMSFKRKKVASFPLRTAEDEAKQRRQIFINSYKFETADKSRRSVCCRKLNKVVSKVKTSVKKLMSSVLDAGAFRSCNCRLANQAFSPKPRSEWF
ncbi:hypothetical protein ACLB2K_058301 [Fragaria x ananassa]